MATPVLMPRQGQSVESCILVAWNVSPGDTVREGQSLAEIETDKATFEIESPAAGTVLELFSAEGEDIPVLTAIGAIGEPGEDASDLRSQAAATKSPSSPAPASASDPEETPREESRQPAMEAGMPGISPRAQNRAHTEGLDPAGIQGTGPGGRIIERDVAAVAAQRPRMTGAARDGISSGLHAPGSGTGPGGMVLSGDLQQPGRTGQTTEIRVTGVRKIIAERMHRSLADTAQLTLNRSLDATAIQSYRAKIKEHGEAYGLPNLTINDLVTFATVHTLKRHPAVNAHFLGDRILQYGDVHLGMAVDTPRGLMVPVLHDAGEMTLVQISSAIRERAEACRKGNVNPDLLSGATFTITNLGSLGVESFTPVLNAPEVAILGVCGFAVKAVMDGSEVRHVPSMNLSLTINHQAVDGAPGARFLSDLCGALENIELLLTARGRPGSNP